MFLVCDNFTCIGMIEIFCCNMCIAFGEVLCKLLFIVHSNGI